MKKSTIYSHIGIFAGAILAHFIFNFHFHQTLSLMLIIEMSFFYGYFTKRGEIKRTIKDKTTEMEAEILNLKEANKSNKPHDLNHFKTNHEIIRLKDKIKLLKSIS